MTTVSISTTKRKCVKCTLTLSRPIEEKSEVWHAVALWLRMGVSDCCVPPRTPLLYFTAHHSVVGSGQAIMSYGVRNMAWCQLAPRGKYIKEWEWRPGLWCLRSVYRVGLIICMAINAGLTTRWYMKCNNIVGSV